MEKERNYKAELVGVFAHPVRCSAKRDVSDLETRIRPIEESVP